MKYKYVTLVALLAVGFFMAISGVRAAEGNWLTDYNKALAQAKQENKKVLINFTGSDWCPWCVKLDKEVFSQKEFQDYAAKNLVLLEVDFPRKKPQSDEVKAANEKLANQYEVEGFPTIVVLDSAGKQIGDLGYEPGGPKAFIQALEELK